MPNLWDSDVELSVDIVKTLIDQQFPDLAPACVQRFAAGWDNIAFLVNSEFVFRFPHRKMGADLMENEVRALRVLMPHLPIPIPNPTFVGGPSRGYPYSFAGYPLIPGTTACRFEWTDELRSINARPLGEFLAALHSVPVDEQTRSWARGDIIERANLVKREPLVIERLRKIEQLVPDVDVEALIRTVEQVAKAEPFMGSPCWVHADLYARHLLVNDEGRLCGVIDWGDVHIGDLALDISIALSFLPKEARTGFESAYGPIDAATWDRARFRAIHYGPPLILYGIDVGDEAIQRAGEDALRFASEI